MRATATVLRVLHRGRCYCKHHHQYYQFYYYHHHHQPMCKVDLLGVQKDRRGKGSANKQIIIRATF
jgi:hypothetical protein